MLRTPAAILLAMLLLAPSALAVKIADITRISGQRSNVMTGLGLVYGLKGTGDGGDFMPAIKPLLGMLSKYADETTVRELANVQNVALVSITASVPPDGIRAGEPVDCYVTSLGAASSLKGGRLFVTPMTGPVPGGEIFALSQGAVELEDVTTPTVGVVKGGCVMEKDWPAHYIHNGQITLLLEAPSASWTTASTIAKIINDSEGTQGETLAVAADPKTVVVTIPPIERDRPDSFISRVQRLPVPLLPTEARVQINQRKGSIIMTGDVEISPVVISFRGLTISTINPAPVPTPQRPIVGEKNAIALDTTGTGGAKLNDLLAIFDQLKVPAEDRISIIQELYKTGKLHAKLIVE
ncbi:MAG TPA: flagellar basal body P-ring protein FlgI [Tepidisphaeraceae bacterium]|jgi:flagellar P-ring protein precursor FlgI